MPRIIQRPHAVAFQPGTFLDGAIPCSTPRFMKIRACLVLSLLLAGAMGPAEAAVGGSRWNVVFLLADDLGWTDLGCFGSDYYQTPNLDRLASEGMKFTRAYAAANCCSPTRGALMTGMYPAKTHLTDWIPGFPSQYSKFKLLPPRWTQHLELRYTTIAEALRDAGYATFHVGKWHLGGEPYYPEHQGFDLNIGGTSRGAPRSYHFPYGDEAMQWNSVLPEARRQGLYLTDRLADEAVALINRSKNRPFFLHLSFYAVHTPVQGPPDPVAKYERLPAGERHRNPRYAAMIESMDAAVGRVRTALETAGIAERTLIIFTSDNGGYGRHVTSNAPLRGEKGQQWEGGERIPGIVYWPGVTRPGSICAEPTITMDYYPTILEVTGARGNARHNSRLDGMSLVPLLRNASTGLGRDALFWHYPHYNVFVVTPYGTVRTRDYKLVEYYEDNHVELYRLADDIGEQHDLAREKPEIAQRLQRELHDFLFRTGAQMPVPNPHYDPNDEVASKFYARYREAMENGR